MSAQQSFDKWAISYGEWVLRRRAWVIAVTLAVMLAGMAGLFHARVDADYMAFFSEDDPQLLEYNHVQQEYTRDDTVFFVVTSKTGEVFDRRVLQAVQHITDKAWLLPHATRVDSLTNFQYVWAEGDDLLVRALIEHPADMTEEDLVWAREIALNEPILQNRLVKQGSPVTGVNVTLHVPEDAPHVSAAITTAARELMHETIALYPEVNIRLTGIVPLNDAYFAGILRDLFVLAPVMVAIILVTMACLLKSFTLMAAVTVVVAFSSLTAVGVLSWLGYRITGPVVAAPLIVLTLAVANCVHVLVSMQSWLRDGKNKTTAILHSVRINIVPTFVTSLTTAIGFLCMNINPVPPLRVLGNVTAFGIMLAFVLAISFLPALVSYLSFRLPRRSREGTMRTTMEKLAEFVLNNKAPLAVGLTLATLLLSWNIPGIRFNNQFVEWFDEHYPIRRDTEYAMDNLTGIYQVIFNMRAKESGGVSEPEYLEYLDKFTTWLARQDGVINVGSITNTMKRLNRAMHGNDPAMYRVPDTRELAAQYLLLYEMSLPRGVDLTTEVNMDKSATRVVVTVRNMHTHELAKLVERFEAWQRQNIPDYMFSRALGPAVMFTQVAQGMIESMFISAPLSLFLVSLTLMAALRSIKYGLISLPPNIMPLAVGFGIWGLNGWDLMFGMTTIVAMSVGIVVDDTVHFLSKYLRARREYNLSPEDGVRYAFSTVGTAMWVTSFILVAGFLVMTLSPMKYSDIMGLLTSLIIVAALAGDFLLLPPMLVYIDGRRQRAYSTLTEVRQTEQAIGVET